MALVELRIGGLAVLDSVSLSPGRQLTVLTGETGAGKSLCITALRAVLGGRVEEPLVRRDRECARVVAVFDQVPVDAKGLLAAHSIDDHDLLTLARDLPLAGRGSCRINGALVSLTSLRSVGEALVEVTGQGESHRLLEAGRQRRLLDTYGGPRIAASRAAVAEALGAWRDAKAALEAARGATSLRESEVESAREVVTELRPLQLREGEDDQLIAERDRLRHAAALATAAGTLWAACGGGDEPGAGTDVIARAAAEAAQLHGVDQGLDELVAEAVAAVSHLRGLASRARTLRDSVEVDRARLAVAEDRLDLLARVCRRHGGCLARALEALQQAEEALTLAGGDDSTLAALSTDVERCRSELSLRAAQLSMLRRTAAGNLERAVTAQLRRLGLPRARLRIVLAQIVDEAGIDVDGELVACTADGVDTVDYRFSASADGVPLPLDGGISGGELSRLALALRAVVAVADDAPTVVLDEVDTGIGGETAARVGEVLASIGQDRQVLVVTHRAEIAARAADHLVVTKQATSDGQSAVVAPVDEDARVLEIARLMSGRPTRAALARAAELLDEGRGGRAVRTIAPR